MGAMLKKLNVPADSKAGLMAAILGAGRGGSKKEYELDSRATFHMSHTRTGMEAYKKASPRITIEVADGIVLPVDGFETIEVDLDQSGSTTKPVKIVAVEYMPGLSWNLLSTLKAVEQWCKSLIYHKMKAVLGSPGDK